MHPINPWRPLFQWIWNADLRSVPTAQRAVVMALRITYVVLRDLLHGQLNLRAMSLVYTTLLSLVPLLAVSFSVLKGFGVHNQIEPLLLQAFAPLGEKGHEIAERILSFVANVKVGVLGSLGLVLLMYTVISLLQKIESAFNFVWRVDRLRGFSERFSNYLSVILVGPVLVFGALGITASVTSNAFVHRLLTIEPLGAMLVELGRLLPYVLVCGAFSFLYILIPNTRVRLRAALTGGLVGGVLWQTAGWGFARFIVTSSSKYAAIYSSFAILILLLIWLYLSWLVLLLGAQVAFYVQHPQYVSLERVQLRISNRLKEHLALAVMALIGVNHYADRRPWDVDELAAYLHMPGETIARVLRILIDLGLVVETCDERSRFLPARDIGNIALVDLIAGVRAAEEDRFLAESQLSRLGPVDDLMQSIEAGIGQGLGRTSVRDLVLGLLQAEPVAATPADVTPGDDR